MTARYGFTAAALVAAMAWRRPRRRSGWGSGAKRTGPVVADLGFDELGGSLGIVPAQRRSPGLGVPRRAGDRQRARGGPAAGRLRDGDAIVAVDGQLITTSEGGRRFSAIDPGDRVRLSIRRGGRVQDVTVQAGTRCQRRPTPPTPPRPPAPPADRRTARPPAPASAARQRRRRPPSPRRAAPAPSAPAASRPPPPAAAPRRASPPAPPRRTLPPAPPPPPEIMPDGWFGFGIQCNNCGVTVAQWPQHTLPLSRAAHGGERGARHPRRPRRHAPRRPADARGRRLHHHRGGVDALRRPSSPGSRCAGRTPATAARTTPP